MFGNEQMSLLTPTLTDSATNDNRATLITDNFVTHVTKQAYGSINLSRYSDRPVGNNYALRAAGMRPHHSLVAMNLTMISRSGPTHH